MNPWWSDATFSIEELIKQAFVINSSIGGSNVYSARWIGSLACGRVEHLNLSRTFSQMIF